MLISLSLITMGLTQRKIAHTKLNRRVITIDGYFDVPPNDGKKLQKAVATQPVSVGICGSDRAFQLYSKGIFSGPCSTSLDHAVLIVGYDSENGVEYWIVKNSWGTSWGMNGYIHMRRNTGDFQGLCGINMLASYPTKTSPNSPPPSPPTPIKCNIFTYCKQRETCCCARHFIGIWLYAFHGNVVAYHLPSTARTIAIAAPMTILYVT